MTDLVTLSTYASMEGWNKFLIGKTPMENPANYYGRSLIYHADRVKTPMLIQTSPPRQTSFSAPADFSAVQSACVRSR